MPSNESNEHSDHKEKIVTVGLSGRDQPGNPYWGEIISTVELLVLTSSDQLFSILKMYICLFYKISYLNEEVKPYRAFRLIKGSFLA
jgi:hypothetical protein